MISCPNEENMLQGSAQMISCEAFMIQFSIVSCTDIVIRDLDSFFNAGASAAPKLNE